SAGSPRTAAYARPQTPRSAVRQDSHNLTIPNPGEDSMSDNQDIPTYGLYINGEWRPGWAEKFEPIYNPATGEVLANVARADELDTRAAIEAARTAFDECPWPCITPGERMRILHGIVDALEEHQEELMAIEIANGGCTWRKATFMDIPVGLIHFRHF